MSQLEKFQYFLSKFPNTICPSFNISNSDDKIFFETSFSGGWGDGGPCRIMTYDKKTNLFSTFDYGYFGYSSLPEPVDETEKYEIKKLEHDESFKDENTICQQCESEYYMYILALCTGANINLCMLSDYLFCLENNLKCKYEDKMQEICENISVLANFKMVLNLIPEKFKSKKIYKKVLKIFFDEEIVKSIPKEYYDEEIANLIMHNTKMNCGMYVVGKDKYDKYMQYIPVEHHEFINNKYKRHLYSTEERGQRIVREHYLLYKKIPSWEKIEEKLQFKNIDTNNMDKETANMIYCVLELPYDESDSDVQVLLNDYLLESKDKNENPTKD